MDEWLLAPLREFGALAERSPIAASIVLGLVLAIIIGGLMRTFFRQRAQRLRDLHEIELAKVRESTSQTDTENLERIIRQSKALFEQAAETVKPQFTILNERLGELIAEQKRSNDLSETNIRQHDIRQREIVTINKQGFNDLGIRINDKIDQMVEKVSGMRDDVIKSLGEQITEMVSEVKQEISKLPDATAKSVGALLEEHQKKIDAQLQTILAEIRAQTKPTEPPAEPPPA